MTTSVLKNFFYLSLVQFSNYVLPFLVIPLLTRALGLDGFGKYAFYLGIANLLMVFVRFGFEFSATRQISISSDDKEKVGGIIGAVVLIKTMVLCLCIAIYSLVIYIAKPDELSNQLMLGGLLLMFGQMLLPIWFFQGIQKMKFVTMYAVVTKLLYVVLLFAFIETENDYGLATIIYGGAFFVAGLLSFFHMAGMNPITIPSSKLFNQTFREAVPFFVSRACVTSYTMAMIPLIGFIGSPAQAAIYAAAEKLYNAAQSAMYPLANALYPHMAKTRDLVLYKKLFIASMILVATGGSIGYFIAPDLIVFLFGEKFRGSIEIFNIHIVALIFLFPSMMLGMPLLAALGFSKEANGVVVIGAAVFIVIATVGWLLGISETEYFVWGIVAAEFVVFLLRAYFSLKKVWFGPSKKGIVG